MRKKHLFVLVLILVMCCVTVFAACSPRKSENNNDDNSKTSVETTEYTTATLMSEVYSAWIEKNRINNLKKFGMDFGVDLNINDKSDKNNDIKFALKVKGNLDVNKTADNSNNECVIELVKIQENTESLLLGLGYEVIDDVPYLLVNGNEAGIVKFKAASLISLVELIEAKSNIEGFDSIDMEDFYFSAESLVPSLSELIFDEIATKKGTEYKFTYNVKTICDNFEKSLSLIEKFSKNFSMEKVDTIIEKIFSSNNIDSNFILDGDNEKVNSVKTLIQFVGVKFGDIKGDVKFNLDSKTNEVVKASIDAKNQVNKQNYSLQLMPIRLGDFSVDVFENYSIDENARKELESYNLINFKAIATANALQNDDDGELIKHKFNIDFNCDLDPIEIYKQFVVITNKLKQNQKIDIDFISSLNLSKLGYINLKITDENGNLQFVMNLDFINDEFLINGNSKNIDLPITFGKVYNFEKLINTIAPFIKRNSAEANSIDANSIFNNITLSIANETLNLNQIVNGIKDKTIKINPFDVAGFIYNGFDSQNFEFNFDATAKANIKNIVFLFMPTQKLPNNVLNILNKIIDFDEINIELGKINPAKAEILDTSKIVEDMNTSTLVSEVYDSWAKENRIESLQKFNFATSYVLNIEDITESNIDSIYKLDFKGNIDFVNSENTKIALILNKNNENLLFELAYEVINGNGYVFIDVDGTNYAKIDAKNITRVIDIVKSKLIENPEKAEELQQILNLKDVDMDLVNLGMDNIIPMLSPIIFGESGVKDGLQYTFNFDVDTICTNFAKIYKVMEDIDADFLFTGVNNAIKKVAEVVSYKYPEVNFSDIKTLIGFVQKIYGKISGNVVFDLSDNKILENAKVEIDNLADKNFVLDIAPAILNNKNIDIFENFTLEEKERKELAISNLIKFKYLTKINAFSQDIEKHVYNVEINSDLNEAVILNIYEKLNEQKNLDALKSIDFSNMGYFNLQINEVNNLSKIIVNLDFSNDSFVVKVDFSDLDIHIGNSYNLNEIIDILKLMISKNTTEATNTATNIQLINSIFDIKSNKLVIDINEILKLATIENEKLQNIINNVIDFDILKVDLGTITPFKADELNRDEILTSLNTTILVSEVYDSWAKENRIESLQKFNFATSYVLNIDNITESNIDSIYKLDLKGNIDFVNSENTKIVLILNKNNEKVLFELAYEVINGNGYIFVDIDGSNCAKIDAKNITKVIDIVKSKLIENPEKAEELQQNLNLKNVDMDLVNLGMENIIPMLSPIIFGQSGVKDGLQYTFNFDVNTICTNFAKIYKVMEDIDADFLFTGVNNAIKKVAEVVSYKYPEVNFSDVKTLIEFVQNTYGKISGNVVFDLSDNKILENAKVKIDNLADKNFVLEIEPAILGDKEVDAFENFTLNVEEREALELGNLLEFNIKGEIKGYNGEENVHNYEYSINANLNEGIILDALKTNGTKFDILRAIDWKNLGYFNFTLKEISDPDLRGSAYNSENTICIEVCSNFEAEQILVNLDLAKAMGKYTLIFTFNVPLDPELGGAYDITGLINALEEYSKQKEAEADETDDVKINKEIFNKLSKQVNLENLKNGRIDIQLKNVIETLWKELKLKKPLDNTTNVVCDVIGSNEKINFIVNDFEVFSHEEIDITELEQTIYDNKNAKARMITEVTELPLIKDRYNIGSDNLENDLKHGYRNITMKGQTLASGEIVEFEGKIYSVDLSKVNKYKAGIYDVIVYIGVDNDFASIKNGRAGSKIPYLPYYGLIKYETQVTYNRDANAEFKLKDENLPKTFNITQTREDIINQLYLENNGIEVVLNNTDGSRTNILLNSENQNDWAVNFTDLEGNILDENLFKNEKFVKVGNYKLRLEFEKLFTIEFPITILDASITDIEKVNNCEKIDYNQNYFNVNETDIEGNVNTCTINSIEYFVENENGVFEKIASEFLTEVTVDGQVYYILNLPNAYVGRKFYVKANFVNSLNENMEIISNKICIGMDIKFNVNDIENVKIGEDFAFTKEAIQVIETLGENKEICNIDGLKYLIIDEDGTINRYSLEEITKTYGEESKLALDLADEQIGKKFVIEITFTTLNGLQRTIKTNEVEIEENIKFIVNDIENVKIGEEFVCNKENLKVTEILGEKIEDCTIDNVKYLVIDEDGNISEFSIDDITKLYQDGDVDKYALNLADENKGKKFAVEVTFTTSKNIQRIIKTNEVNIEMNLQFTADDIENVKNNEEFTYLKDNLKIHEILGDETSDCIINSVKYLLIDEDGYEKTYYACDILKGYADGEITKYALDIEDKNLNNKFVIEISFMTAKGLSRTIRTNAVDIEMNVEFKVNYIENIKIGEEFIYNKENIKVAEILGDLATDCEIDRIKYLLIDENGYSRRYYLDDFTKTYLDEGITKYVLDLDDDKLNYKFAIEIEFVTPKGIIKTITSKEVKIEKNIEFKVDNIENVKIGEDFNYFKDNLNVYEILYGNKEKCKIKNINYIVKDESDYARDYTLDRITSKYLDGEIEKYILNLPENYENGKLSIEIEFSTSKGLNRTITTNEVDIEMNLQFATSDIENVKIGENFDYTKDGIIVEEILGEQKQKCIINNINYIMNDEYGYSKNYQLSDISCENKIGDKIKYVLDLSDSKIGGKFALSIDFTTKKGLQRTIKTNEVTIEKNIEFAVNDIQNVQIGEEFKYSKNNLLVQETIKDAKVNCTIDSINCLIFNKDGDSNSYEFEDIFKSYMDGEVEKYTLDLADNQIDKDFALKITFTTPNGIQRTIETNKVKIEKNISFIVADIENVQIAEELKARKDNFEVKEILGEIKETCNINSVQYLVIDGEHIIKFGEEICKVIEINGVQKHILCLPAEMKGKKFAAEVTFTTPKGLVRSITTNQVDIEMNVKFNVSDVEKAVVGETFECKLENMVVTQSLNEMVNQCKAKSMIFVFVDSNGNEYKKSLDEIITENSILNVFDYIGYKMHCEITFDDSYGYERTISTNEVMVDKSATLPVVVQIDKNFNNENVLHNTPLNNIYAISVGDKNYKISYDSENSKWVAKTDDGEEYVNEISVKALENGYYGDKEVSFNSDSALMFNGYNKFDAKNVKLIINTGIREKTLKLNYKKALPSYKDFTIKKGSNLNEIFDVNLYNKDGKLIIKYIEEEDKYYLVVKGTNEKLCQVDIKLKDSWWDNYELEKGKVEKVDRYDITISFTYNENDFTASNTLNVEE